MASDFIKMISALHGSKYSQTMQGIAKNKIPCGLFLAPAVPKNIQPLRDFVKARNLNLICVCTMNKAEKELWQPAEVEVVVSLEEFPDLKNKPKFMFNLKGFFHLMFTDYFNRFGIKMFGFNDNSNAENRYEFYMKHLPELSDAHDMFADDESKKVFRAYMTGRVTNIIQDFRFAPEPQYFLEGFLPTKGDIAIDGGAFDGATSLDFAKCGAKVFGFEMNENNYKNCMERIKNSGGDITIENLGLSEREGDAFYSLGAAGSRKLAAAQGTTGLTGHFINLDVYAERKKLPRVDYIKLDIEGSELEMLRGAAKTITRYKPKMAISAYHRAEDLWTLANYIKSIRSDYEFKFRHYRIDCTDYLFNDRQREIFRSFGLNYFCPSNCEAVLYCK